MGNTVKPPSREPDDPILSPDEMAADAGISPSTWVREYRYDPDLELFQLSARRLGARLSNWRSVVGKRRLAK
jgi:hypothetical protein